MFSATGDAEIGHGVIYEVSNQVVESQLEKKLQDSNAYTKQILEEFRYEQPMLYNLFEATAKKVASQLFNEQKQPNKYQFVIDNYMFNVAYLYKVISVSIEARWMNEDIRL